MSMSIFMIMDIDNSVKLNKRRAIQPVLVRLILFLARAENNQQR